MSKAFTIDRSKWVNGEVWRLQENASTALLNYGGRMCCLGFYSLACGMTPAEIQDVGTPADLCQIPSVMDWLVEDDAGTPVPSDECHRLMHANDSVLVSSAEREKKITDLFQSRGIAVTFTGDLFPDAPTT